jgi:predicted DNA-binding WGR domain protein
VIARDLQKAGAGLRSIAEPVVDNNSDFAELVLAMLGVAAKLERRRIKERTARGRADAKAKGMKFGRKPKLTAHQMREAIKRCDRGRRNAALDRPQLQFQRGDAFEARIMSAVHLTRIDPARNMRRFYRLDVQPDLFGGFAVVKEWGRSGARGRMVGEWHMTRRRRRGLAAPSRTETAARLSVNFASAC